MLRWMSGKTRHDMIMNDTIRERFGVAPIVKKMVENNRLRWFEYVEKRLVNVVVQRVDQMEEGEIKRGRKRPRKTIRIVRKDLEANELDPDMVYDKTL